MDVDTVEVNECKTSTCAPLHEASDLNIAAEASPPMPASSSLHTEQQESPVTRGQADAEMQPDEELSDEEAGTDDEEKNANNTTHRLVKNTAAVDRKVDKCFDELTSVIVAHQKRLQNKKSMLTDAKAAATILDLEALQQFNQIQHKLHLKIHERPLSWLKPLPKRIACYK